MNEGEFQKRVTDMATRFGWKWWHVPAPMKWTAEGWVGAHEAAGLPDLVLIHDDPPRMIFAELKGDGGKLSDKQTEFLGMAKNVADHGHDLAYGDGAPFGVYVWLPEHENIVEQILRTRVLM